MDIILGSGEGNFGVVTEITYKTYPLKKMYDVEMVCEYPFVRKDELINDISIWLKFQKKAKASKGFTSMVRLVKFGEIIKIRILVRIADNKLEKIKNVFRKLNMLQNGKFSFSTFSPYSISELSEYKDYLTDLHKQISIKKSNQLDLSFDDLKEIYQQIKENAITNGIESYLGTPFYYELSHQQDSNIADTSSNYSCRTPRKHKVTSTFVKPSADLSSVIAEVLNYFFTNKVNENNYSICTFHTIGGKAGSANTSYGLINNDFLLQIQSWLPEHFNEKEIEDNMEKWVNNFKDLKLMLVLLEIMD